MKGVFTYAICGACENWIEIEIEAAQWCEVCSTCLQCCDKNEDAHA